MTDESKAQDQEPRDPDDFGAEEVEDEVGSGGRGGDLPGDWEGPGGGFEPLPDFDEPPGFDLRDLAGFVAGSRADDLAACREIEQKLQHREDRHLRELPSTVDPHDLAEAGWGVILGPDAAHAAEGRLRPLLERREEEAGKRYRRIDYHEGDSGWTFLGPRHGETPGVIDPDVLPYYLLIVGGPEEVPFEVQYRLSINHAVGRVAFEDPEGYAHYARAVARAEDGGATVGRQVGLFSVEDDGPTELLAEHLVAPLAARLPELAAGWESVAARGADATPERLRHLVGAQAPGLLLLGCHGVRLQAGRIDQELFQGALKCHGGSFFHAGHVDGGTDLAGQVVVTAACYGAGTPQLDNFPWKSDGPRQELARRPFVARLPQELLSRGALAFVGHVDRGWTTSFAWYFGDQERTAVRSLVDAVGQLLRGERLGHALRPLSRRYTALGAVLAGELEPQGSEPEPTGDEGTRRRLKFLWTAYNDARNFVVLGDPAVYVLGRRAAPRRRSSSSAAETSSVRPPRRPAPNGDTLESRETLLLQVEKGERQLLYKLQPRFEGFRQKLLRDPQKHFQELYRFVEEEMTGPDSYERLKALGVSCCDELMPPGLRERLLAARSEYRTLQIVSYEAWIPWELLYLRESGGQLADGAFLAEAFQLTRRLEGWEPATELPLTPLGLVMPQDAALPEAAAERDSLRSLAGAVEDVEAHRDSVIRAMRSGRFRAWHFLGHGLRGASSHRRSFLLEDAEELRPFDLERVEQFRGTRPLVFLNACHSAQGVPSLSRAGGLVEALRKARAGAVIAPRWAVSDTAAFAFSRAFYESFLAGRTLGEAVQEARLAVRRDHPDDPAWLAYSAFGDPLARRHATAPSRHATAPSPRAAPTPPDPRRATSTRRPESRWRTMTQSRATIVAAVIMAVATLLAAWLKLRDPDGSPPQELLVRVADRSGAGVRGAEVILFVEGGPFQAVADSLGAARLRFRLQGDPSGQLVVQAPDYEITERAIQPLREKMIDLRLDRPGSEAGRVLFRILDAAGGEPVAQATVQLFLGADPYTEVTDSHGLVRFEVDFRDGKSEAQLSVLTEEYTIEHQRVTLLPDKLQNVVLDRRAGALSPEGAGPPQGWQQAQKRQRVLAYNNEGVELLQEGRLTEARRVLDKALELDPDSVEVILNRALLEEGAGDERAALDSYRELIRLAPEEALHHYSLGAFRLRQGYSAEAVDSLDLAIELRSDYAEAYNELGNAYLGMERPDLARQKLEAGLLLSGRDETRAALYKNLARALVEIGDDEATRTAIRHLGKALELFAPEAWGRREATFLLADASARLGERETACEHLRDFARLAGSEASEWEPTARKIGERLGCPVFE